MSDRIKMLSESSSKANIEVVLDSIDAAVITINPEGIILEANAATSRLFKYANVEIVGRNVSMLMPEPFRSEHDNYLKNHIKTGYSSIIGVGRQVSGMRSDGSVFPLHLAVGKHTNNGEMLFTGIIHDLTSQVQQTEDRIRLGQILNSSVNEIFVFDSESLQFSMISRGALANLGYSREEMLKMTPLDIKPQHTIDTFQELITPLQNGVEERIQFSTVHKRKDGTLYDVNVSLSLSDSSESKKEYFAVIEDVTEKNKLLEVMQQSQRLDSIGLLTGGIAHDFNNILTVISGNLEILELSMNDTDLIELVTDAKEASKMGARLTNRLLAFASRNTLMPSSISANTLITNMFELLSRTIGENIHLSTNLHPQLWSTRVDMSQLENSIVNLAINARDAMPEGGTLCITTDNISSGKNNRRNETDNSTDYVRIVVTDTGVGIPEDKLPHIFEPFFTTKGGTTGTGMGLSMIYGFVRQSNGFIDVDSTLDKGTAFSIYLPRDFSEVDPIDENQKTFSMSHTQKHKHILLVEDEEKVRRLAKRHLERMGHHVIEASDGYEAIKQFNDNKHINLVFSDMIMSAGMTGFELALKLQAIKSELSIVITSGYANELLNLEKINEAGMKFLRKPYSEQELRDKIEGQ